MASPDTMARPLPGFMHLTPPRGRDAVADERHQFILPRCHGIDGDTDDVEAAQCRAKAPDSLTSVTAVQRPPCYQAQGWGGAGIPRSSLAVLHGARPTHHAAHVSERCVGRRGLTMILRCRTSAATGLIEPARKLPIVCAIMAHEPNMPEARMVAMTCGPVR